MLEGNLLDSSNPTLKGQSETYSYGKETSSRGLNEAARIGSGSTRATDLAQSRHR